MADSIMKYWTETTIHTFVCAKKNLDLIRLRRSVGGVADELLMLQSVRVSYAKSPNA